MIAAIIAILTSSAGGAIAGFLKLMIERRAEERARAAEHTRLREMRGDDRLEDLYKYALETERANTTPVTLSQRKTLRLGRWTYEKEAETQRIPVPFRVRRGGFLLGVLVFTYCIATLALINAGSAPIATFDPQSSQGGWGIAWGLLDFRPSRSTVATLSAAGLGVWMLTPIVFIMSAWIVGATATQRQ